MSVRDHYMRNLWRWSVGVPEVEIPTHRFPTLKDAEHNWFPEAIALMRNRMIQGIYRYGYFRSPDQPNYNRIASAIVRLQEYQRPGNGEHLIDTMNLCGIEFTKKAHPNFHFQAIDDGIHTEVE